MFDDLANKRLKLHVSKLIEKTGIKGKALPKLAKSLTLFIGFRIICPRGGSLIIVIAFILVLY
jgi:hypothetical protein